MSHTLAAHPVPILERELITYPFRVEVEGKVEWRTCSYVQGRAG